MLFIKAPCYLPGVIRYVKGKAARLYGVSIMPGSYFIDASGDVVAIYRGFKDKDIHKIKNYIKLNSMQNFNFTK